MIYKTFKFNNINYSKKKFIPLIKFYKKNINILNKIINNELIDNKKPIKIIKNLIQKIRNNLINNKINKIIVYYISINKYKTYKKLLILAKGRSSIIKKQKSILTIKIKYN